MISETISHYRIIKKLVQGGMGLVYLAEDLTLSRQVVMKILSVPTNEFRASFLQEAKILSGLAHPNIPRVLECGETVEAQPYIVMEFVDGDSLRSKLRGGALAPSLAASIVSEVAAALSEVHRRGVVHRDVKPSNVLICDMGQVKLIDFGVSRLVSEKTNPGPIQNSNALLFISTDSDPSGTFGYGSPEQVAGRSVGESSDLFALGTVLYECITGRAAFSGSSWAEVRKHILHTTPPAPSKINRLVPPELERIAMKAIEKKVEDRYQYAEQIIEDLQAYSRLWYEPSGPLGPVLPGRTTLALPKAKRRLQHLESEFDTLLACMQSSKSKRAVKAAFESSPAQLGRAAVRQARKKA